MTHAWAIAALLGLTAQDGGKLSWKGKNEEPRTAMEEARRQGRAFLLFFTSEGCATSASLYAGAFSDPKVVEASAGLACVFVDCGGGKKNQELSERFAVRSYPTAVFCDSNGNFLETLRSHDAEEVAAQMRAIAAKVAGDAERPPLPDFPDYTARSLEEAKKASKPLAIYFHDRSPGTASMNTTLAAPLLKGMLAKFYVTKTTLRPRVEDSGTYDVNEAPTILVLNPNSEFPALKPMAKITGIRNARELWTELEAALRLRGGAEPPRAENAPPGPKPVLTKEDEALSDDEVDRQFIQASMRVAHEWVRKGWKTKAIVMLDDLVKTYPKQVATKEARALLEELRKKP